MLVTDEEESVDLTLDNLATEDGIVHLGVLCVQGLQQFGCVTLYADEGGGINLANPIGVFLNAGAVKAPDRPPKFIRPILLNGRPQFVAMKEGTLWEVEYPDEQEDTGSEDH